MESADYPNIGCWASKKFFSKIEQLRAEVTYSALRKRNKRSALPSTAATPTTSSTPASITEIILPSDFTLSIAPASLTLVTGHHATLTLTATSVGELSNTLQLTIGPLPLFTTTTFTPAALKLTPNGSSSSRIYLDTDAVIGYLSQIHPRRNPTIPLWSRLAGALIFILPPLSHRRGRRLPTLIAVAIMATLLIGATGCSGKYPGSNSPGNYKLQITATGTQTPITHSIALPVTVTD